jgi:hypothetical protein
MSSRSRNEVEPARKFKGVWICAALWDHDGLSYAEKFLVAEIDSLSDKDKPCFASNEFLAKRLKIAPRYMNNMLAKLTADGFLHRLGFDGRSTLRCVSPEISSNPSAARQLIKKYSIQTKVKAERRVHKNVKAEFTQKLGLTSQKCEPEISSREAQKRNDDDDQLKLHAQVATATTPAVVVASSSSPDNNDDEPTENLSSNPDGPSKRINRYRKNPRPAVGNIRDQDTLDAIMEADSPSEIRKTDFGKSENRSSPNPESGSREIEKTAFGNIEQENTNKRNDDDDRSKLHEQLPAKQPVAVVASSWPDDDDEPAEIVEKLTEKLKLSYDQSKTVQFYLDQDGKGYVLEKVALTRSKDLRNAGGFFMRALEKDYQEPVTNTKPAPPPKKKRVELKPEEQPATDEERAQTSAKLKEFIQTLRASC